MADYLSQPWLERYVALGSDLPEEPGLDLVMQFVIEGAPAGKVRWYQVVKDGRIVEAELGKSADASITITWKYEYAQKMIQGDLSLDAAYMQGRVKVEGDHAAWLLLWGPVFRSAAYEELRKRLAVETDFG